MPHTNIFKLEETLNKLHASHRLSDWQHQFISSIIRGELIKDGWKSLKAYIQNPTLAQTRSLITAIQQEIHRTPYFSNFIYVRALKNAVSILEGIQKHFELVATYSTKDPALFIKAAKRRDPIYDTLDRYEGTLVLPVIQALDVRLGSSRGECFGFVAKWAQGLLENQKAFGVSIKNPPPFKPIRINSPVGRKYPDLNQLAHLKKDTSIFQTLQHSFPTLTRIISSRLGYANEIIKIEQIKDFSFYKSIKDVAQELITRANNEPDKIYNLNVMGYTSGHAVGFCKLDDKYHFFDSNIGWMHFGSAEGFKRWFPFYYKTIGYDTMFSEYAINSYSRTPKEQNELNKKGKNSTGTTITLIILAAIFSPILLALALLLVAGMLTNHFIIRGFKYAAIALRKQLQSGEQIAEEPVPVLTQAKIEDPVTLPKSLAHLDLAVRQPKAPIQSDTMHSSYATLDALLDIPRKNMESVASRAANKEEKGSVASLFGERDKGTFAGNENLNTPAAACAPSCGS